MFINPFHLDNQMLVPLLGLFLGIPILTYAVLGYADVAILRQIPRLKSQKGNLLLALGLGAIAIALMLGMVGYLSPINSNLIRYVRASVGAAGLILTGYQVRIIWFRGKSFNSLLQNFQNPKSLQQRQVQRYWELLYVLVSRNLKVRYRGSLLGVYWSLLNPLIMTGLYTAIFGATFASYYHNSIFNYILAAFTGLVVINFFSASTSQALSSIVGNGAMLNKIRLPISIFPVSMIAANVFQFAIGVFPLIAIITLIKSKSLINLLALLIPCFALILVCTGIGLLVSALYVFFRDLPYFYELIVFMLLMSSPVFYPADIVPPQIKPFLLLNPLSPIIESLRQISLEQAPPNINLIWGTLLSSVVILALGCAFFQLWRHKFMDLL